MEGALTGGLWYNWFSKLEKHVAPTDRRAPVVFKPAPGLGARTASVVEGTMTLDGLTQSAHHQYLLDNVFVFLDKIQTRWSIPAGSVVRVRSLLKQALQHGLDESKLDELQLLANAIQITEAPMCISCKAFNGRVRHCSTLRCLRRRVITPDLSRPPQPQLKWMCGKCFARYNQIPEAERPPVVAPAAAIVNVRQAVEATLRAEGGIASHSGYLSGVNGLQVQSLFTNAVSHGGAATGGAGVVAGPAVPARAVPASAASLATAASGDNEGGTGAGSGGSEGRDVAPGPA